MDYKKIIIKVLSEKSGKGVPTWEHFCYAPRRMYRLFLEATGKESCETVNFIQDWAKTDFGFIKNLSHTNNIIELRAIITAKSPYSDASISGLTKQWFCKHMMEEIERCKLPTQK